MVTEDKCKEWAILCISVSNTIDTILKFDANADVNVNIDVQCEWALTHSTFLRQNLCVHRCPTPWDEDSLTHIC